MAAFCTRLGVKFKSEVIVRVGTVLLYFLPEVGQKRTSETMYLLRYVGKGAVREMEDKSLPYILESYPHTFYSFRRLKKESDAD
jgi:hypothetical protein